ncbi:MULTISPECIES: DUF2989 domain-containing protein [Vibrio]|uniref:DUF2989 domain-containing protein n=1 Tax=Vibrio TaxID=662 RepID=UPI002074E6DB|nr:MULTISPECIES: DUF2989 domain-containing protein [Vibrio]USD31627.1 DUF2989 domain-containing protein [Vibrio sp. SCSIO 43186]USD44670.1 DUF2989 domain-containing protein [Vibrio sp. SCSIO 43145]USD68750.1 DUF2989 domain-containing protein [Vibrio sp. SCSIO 43139]USD96440.1 hypothetical protein CTT30_10230 [Vibrio coralliilyticus]
MKHIKALLIFSMPIALIGCFENRQNTDKLCADNPSLQCERLNMNDGQCRVPRTDLIWHRYEVLKQPTDSNIIEEYRFLAGYKKCLELASQIQPIEQAGLKERRFNALMNSGEDLEKLIERIRQSNSPESLYFLWSQTGDDQAQRSFLQLEGTPALETAEMQYALATFYTSRDLEKTVDLLNKSLELSEGKNLNTEIFKTLASITYQLDRKEQAYVWAMVAKRFDVPIIGSEQEMQILYGFSQEKYEQLDGIADTIENALESGSFQRNMVPSFN